MLTEFTPDRVERAGNRRGDDMRVRIRSKRAAVVAVLAITTLLGACTVAPPALPTPHAGGLDPDLAPQADVAAYTGPGPYAAGVTTVELEPGRKMEVWYPAPKADAVGHTPDTYFIRDFLPALLTNTLPASVNPPFVTDGFRDLPAAPGGPFPLVLFSHGVISYRLQSTFLTTHLASWGFVVISPDYLERGIQSLGGTPAAPNRTDDDVAQMAVDSVSALNTGTGTLAGKVDTSRLFPIGHSAGGAQSTRLAGSRTDVQSWIAMSAGVSVTPTIFNLNPTVPAALNDPAKSAMWLVGDSDHVAQPAGVQSAYDYTSGERKIVVVPNSGHNNAMSDICEIGRADGGLVGLAASGGLILPDFVTNLANDGCPSPPNFTGPQVWPIVRHFVTAELRYRSGLDPVPVGLGSGVVNQFGAVTPSYQHSQ